jgi:putative aldouronate transport system substrate-binding protein
MFKRNASVKYAGAAWVLMLVLGLLAACGGSTAPTTTAPTAAGSAGTAPTAAPAANATAAPATTELAPVTLTLTYRAQPQPDLKLVEAELNKLLQARISTAVKLNPIDPSAWDDRIKLMVAGGEKLDLVFTANWTNNYYQNVAQGNFIPLDDLLPRYAPKLLASMTPEVWDGASIKGHIYGVPNQILFAQPWGVYFRKDLVEKYKFDISKVKEYVDIEPFLKQIKEGEPGITPIYSNDKRDGQTFRAEDYNFELVGSNTGIAIREDDPNLKAFNVFATPEYKQTIEMARRWYLAGYYDQDPLPESDAAAAFKAGKFALGLHLVPPGNEASLKSRFGWDFVQQPITKQLFITTGRVTSNMLAISRTSQNPERAMMLLELLNSDKEVFNTLANGIEGKHWVWVDKVNQVIGFPEGVTPQTNGYNPNTPYLWGNVFNGSYTNESLVGLWDEHMRINKTAPASAGLGFAPDFSSYSTEVAQINAVIGEYNLVLGQGRLDPATGLPEFLKKLDQAGMPAMLAEVQRQLDEWKASKH